MNLHKASLATALAVLLAAGGFAGQAMAMPHDGSGHPGHGSRMSCVYDALTPEKQAQFDGIMKEFADKTAPLRDKLAAKYLELRTLGDSPTPDPKAIGKATEELVALRNDFARERQAMADRIAKEVGINVFQKRYGCEGCIEQPRRCPVTGTTAVPEGPENPEAPAKPGE